MTTPPPPPPGNGSGGSQPYEPSGPGSAPGPSSPGSGVPSYGNGPSGPSFGSGQPPQAPPPAPGGAPQQGGGDKAKIMSIISIVTGVIGLCCCLFSIVAVVLGVLGRNEYAKSGEKQTLANIGLGLGIAGLVIFVISFILQMAGVWEPYSWNFETS